MENHEADHGKSKLLVLTLGALGVVFGDIGTSPLYAINEIFFGPSHTLISKLNVLESISLVFWALTIVICIKYVLLVLRADNEGEGGIFALYSLLIKKIKAKQILWIAGFLIFSSGLLFGDGMITPAISVVSAVEGLKVITSGLEAYVVPITVVILTALFLFQSKGTHKVGKIFGPVVVLWFSSLALIGGSHLIQNPEILMAINPKYALLFLTTHPLMQVLFVLGSVMLVITGGEALYADMGHFGKKPIRMAWFFLVYPALLLNYFGQGAFLLSGSEIIGDNIFYSMVPRFFLVPEVILATFATIIASQALISGAFSIASQAIRLGLLPRLQIIHTHHEHEGQIYIPFINWMIYAGCIFFVLVFKSSTNLANAYGLAVSGDMVITTLAMFGITLYLWKWKPIYSFLALVPLLIIDITFFAANSLKIPKGGFIPLLIGLLFFIVIKTWQWGRREVRKVYMNYSSMTLGELIKIKKSAPNQIPRSIIITTPYKLDSLKDNIPPVKQIFWERYGLLPKNLLFLTVHTLSTPFLHKNRYEVHNFYNDPEKGSITSLTLNFGFMEELNVEGMLKKLDKSHVIDIEDDPKDWLIHISRTRLIYPKTSSFLHYLRLSLLDLMFKLFNFSDYYFGLGNKIKLTMEVVPVVFK